MYRRLAIVLGATLLAEAAATSPAAAQQRTNPPARATTRATDSTSTRVGGPSIDSLSLDRIDTRARPAYGFKSRADSLEWMRAKASADRATGFRVVVSLLDFRLWVLLGKDTLLNAPVAVASGATVEHEGRRFTFTMPRGVRTVLRKEADPVWIPPDWFYYETAQEHGLKVGTIRGTSMKLPDGRQIVIRDSMVGVIGTNGKWEALPVDEHIVFRETLYIPPMGTRNRRIEGALGKFRLDMGEGFLLHGTPYKNSIGTAATHGCVRLRDEDIEWLHQYVPVGTKVYIY